MAFATKPINKKITIKNTISKFVGNSFGTCDHKLNSKIIGKICQ